MNGRGVFLSKKTGRLIATLEPRRRRMLAVSVLYSDGFQVLITVLTHSTHGKRACGFVISSGRNKLWLEIASVGS